MSNRIFIPVTNRRVFEETTSWSEKFQVRQEVIDFLRESCAPYYVCRRPVLQSQYQQVGETFYFSKENAVMMFKLAWGGH